MSSSPSTPSSSPSKPTSKPHHHAHHTHPSDSSADRIAVGPTPFSTHFSGAFASHAPSSPAARGPPPTERTPLNGGSGSAGSGDDDPEALARQRRYRKWIALVIVSLAVGGTGWWAFWKGRAGEMLRGSRP